MSFVHLHCHTEFSLLDGLPKVEQYIIDCVEHGQPGIAVTEHGNLRSILKLQKAAAGKFTYDGKDYNLPAIKPVFGIEFYVSHRKHNEKGLEDVVKSDLKRDCKGDKEYKERLKALEEEVGVRQYYHLLCFAKDEEGLKNIFNLSYLAYRDGFYYRPRIDSELLFRYKQGLIVTTSCISSPCNRMVIAGDMDGAYEWVKKVKAEFDKDFYLELQPHDIDEQRKCNISLVDFSRSLGVSLIATNDCHYVKKEDVESHQILTKINTFKSKSSTEKQQGKEEDAWVFSGVEFYLKTEQEMRESFARYHKKVDETIVAHALENTTEILEKCNTSLHIDSKKAILPSVEIPTTLYKSPYEYLVALCKKGWKDVGISRSIKAHANASGRPLSWVLDVYKKRLALELSRINQLKFSKYFLIIYDIIDWARRNDILVGPGRGSSGGSLVCYLLGITMVDPIEHDLLFDRFLSMSRVDYPDIDIDFEDARRQEVFDYIIDKYGAENCAQIGTYGKMKGKLVMLDVSRIFDVPVSEVYVVNKHIQDSINEDDPRAFHRVEDAFKLVDVCKKFHRRYPEVYPHAKALEGRVKQPGVHAAGIVISDRPIHEVCPIEHRKDVKVTAFDKNEVEQLGLLKVDVLGLSALTVIKSAIRMIHKDSDVLRFLRDIPLNDKKVLDAFTRGEYAGVFQFDSVGMTKITEDMVFRGFMDVAAMSAVYRPGSTRSGASDHFIKRNAGIEQVKKIHPIFDKITKTTYGIVVFQEQFMELFVKLGGYTPTEADQVRKKMAKSKGIEAITKHKKRFVDNAVGLGMSQDVASKIFKGLIFFGQYAFNKSHAVEYSIISFWQMWLKIYYRKEYFCALLNNEKDNDNIARFVVEARRLGIDILMPDVNESDVGYKIVDGGIRCGLSTVKRLGEKAANEISRHQPYSGFKDFCEKVNRRVVNRGVINALIGVGAMNTFYEKSHVLLQPRGEGKRQKLLWEEMIAKKTEEDAQVLYDDIAEVTPDMTEEQNLLLQLEHSPIPGTKHKIEYYPLSNRLLKTQNISQIDWQASYAVIRGVIVDIKYNNVGDFDKGTDFTDKEKKLRHFGARYAKFSIDDGTGIVRVQLDWQEFPTFRHIIDCGVGKAIAIRGTLYDKGKTVYASLICDLDEMEELCRVYEKGSAVYKAASSFVRCMLLDPTKLVKRKMQDAGHKTVDVAKLEGRVGKFRTVIMVWRTKEWWTKKGELMYFADVGDYTGVTNILVWPGIVEDYKKVFVPGNILDCFLEKDDSKTTLYSAKKVANFYTLAG